MSRAACPGFDIFQRSHSGRTPKCVFSWSFYLSSCFTAPMSKALTFHRTCDSLLVIRKVSCWDGQTPPWYSTGRPAGRPPSQKPAEPLRVATLRACNTSSTSFKIICICTSATSQKSKFELWSELLFTDYSKKVLLKDYKANSSRINYNDNKSNNKSLVYNYHVIGKNKMCWSNC